jgi:hypothetical protein
MLQNVLHNALMRSRERANNPGADTMKTIDNLRDEFRAYFAHLRDAQRADGAPVPNRREEWSRFVAHYIDEGFIPAEAANWTCPR